MRRQLHTDDLYQFFFHREHSDSPVPEPRSGISQIVAFGLPPRKLGHWHASLPLLGMAHRKHGISDATFYKWGGNYEGLDVSDVKKLRQLEDENRRLKQMVV